MSKIFKIGTRGSLLAVTQCTLIAQEMTKRTGAKFELVKIITQGDAQTDKPLWQMDGKDFFTKELDHALLANEVDLVVHSYKDLGSDRPDGIGLGAITERAYANDILLIRKDNITKIKDKDIFNVGTSSPRRIVNAESSLIDFLPGAKEGLEVKCSMLRGNVNTRIQKLKDGNYDAIILALAGLERLASKEDSKIILEELLEGLTFMVMPQKVFPSSCSQGALAIEYNQIENNAEVLEILKSVHCDTTALEVRNERALFQTYGGGCHLAVGIHTQTHKGFLLDIEKGMHDDKIINKTTLHGASMHNLKNKNLFLPLGDKDKLVNKEPLNPKLEDNKAYFVTSSYCLEAVKGLKNSVLYASGSRTMKKLISQGQWVNASADSLGHKEISKINSSIAVRMMTKDVELIVLSHEDAKSEIGDVVACYKRVVKQEKIDLSSAEAFYWSSYFQYQTYLNQYPEIKDKLHACGLGKTYDQFVENGIEVTPVESMSKLKETCRIL
jgi:hydroxymethylbilane synthase